MWIRDEPRGREPSPSCLAEIRRMTEHPAVWASALHASTWTLARLQTKDGWTRLEKMLRVPTEARTPGEPHPPTTNKRQRLKPNKLFESPPGPPPVASPRAEIIHQSRATWFRYFPFWNGFCSYDSFVCYARLCRLADGLDGVSRGAERLLKALPSPGSPTRIQMIRIWFRLGDYRGQTRRKQI